jgi:uncharacterized protein
VKIAVIGASGRIGRAAVREALARGHQVTAIARDTARLVDLGSATVLSADVLDRDAIAHAVATQDAVLAAVTDRRPGRINTIPEAARVLLDALPTVGVRRLLFAGGGSTLQAATGTRFVDTADFPPEYRDEALAQAEALEILRSSKSPVEWSYASPPPVHLLDGAKTGHYRVKAGDQPITDEHGDTRITVGDYAAALVDELERGAFLRQRFTAAY